MKRYLIFGAIGPFTGGLLLLFLTTYESGYWEHTSVAEVQKFFLGFVRSLPYNYLFGLVPSLMIGAVDDILCHVRRIGPVMRMLIVSAECTRETIGQAGRIGFCDDPDIVCRYQFSEIPNVRSDDRPASGEVGVSLGWPAATTGDRVHQWQDQHVTRSAPDG